MRGNLIRNTHTWFFPFGVMNHDTAPMAAMTIPTRTTWKNVMIAVDGGNVGRIEVKGDGCEV